MLVGEDRPMNTYSSILEHFRPGGVELSGQASRQVDGDLVADVFAKPLAELHAEGEHVAAPAGDHQSYIRKLDPVNGSVHTDGLLSAEELCRSWAGDRGSGTPHTAVGGSRPAVDQRRNGRRYSVQLAGHGGTCQ